MSLLLTWGCEGVWDDLRLLGLSAEDLAGHRDAEELHRFVASAYRKLSLRAHPDKGGCPRRFRQIVCARDHVLAAAEALCLREAEAPRSATAGQGFRLPVEVNTEITVALNTAHDLPKKRRAPVLGPLSASLRRLSEVLPSLSAHIEAVVTGIAEILRSDWLRHQQQRSWSNIGLKSFSFDGFDWKRMRIVDYGNFCYRCLLLLCAKENHAIANVLDYLAEHFGDNFSPAKPDGKGQGGTLDRQGDIIEIAMAVARGHGDFGLRARCRLGPADCQEFFSMICSSCQDLHQVWEAMVGVLRPVSEGCWDWDPTREERPWKQGALHSSGLLGSQHVTRIRSMHSPELADVLWKVLRRWSSE